MAHKKGGGSTKNTPNRGNAKRLGIKAFDTEFVKAGAILVRQRGAKIFPGEHVGMGKDHSIFAKVKGKVEFKKTKTDRTFVSVKPN